LRTIDSTIWEMSSTVLIAAVHRLDDVLPLDHVDRLELAAEETCDRAMVDGIAVTLEAVDGVEQLAHVLDLLEAVDELGGLLPGADQLAQHHRADADRQAPGHGTAGASSRRLGVRHGIQVAPRASETSF